jgi:hypothetical protein
MVLQPTEPVEPSTVTRRGAVSVIGAVICIAIGFFPQRPN